MPSAGRGRPARRRRDRGRRRALRLRGDELSRCCTTCADHRRGRTPRARRPDGRGQVDAGQADRTVLRPERGRDHASAASICATRRVVAARAHRRGPAGRLPVQRHHPRERADRSRRRHRRRDRSRARSRSAYCERFARCRKASTPRSRARLAAVGRREAARVARARGARNPAVLVLDEATSSLDPGTEAMVERAMTRLMAGRTVVVIAHRLSTAERGRSRRRRRRRATWSSSVSHDELIARGGRYAALYGSWAGSAV